MLQQGQTGSADQSTILRNVDFTMDHNSTVATLKRLVVQRCQSPLPNEYDNVLKLLLNQADYALMDVKSAYCYFKAYAADHPRRFDKITE